MGGNTMDDEDRDPNNLNRHLQVTWVYRNYILELCNILAYSKNWDFKGDANIDGDPEQVIPGVPFKTQP